MNCRHLSAEARRKLNGEPVFILRAQDALAARVVRFWADLAEEAEVTSAVVADARRIANDMDSWPTKKRPD